MSVFATLLRERLRRDRWQLLIWILGTAVLAYVTYVGVSDSYGTQQDRAALLATAIANPVIMLFRGLPSGAGEGAFMLFLIFPFLAMMAAFMSSFLAVRHTRMDEELGRAELVAATPAGRTLPLVATRVPRHPGQSRARAADLPRPAGHGARGTGVLRRGLRRRRRRSVVPRGGAPVRAAHAHLTRRELARRLGAAAHVPDRRPRQRPRNALRGSAAHRELLADLALAIRVGRELPAVRGRQRVAAVAVRRVRSGVDRSLIRPAGLERPGRESRARTAGAARMRRRLWPVRPRWSGG